MRDQDCDDYVRMLICLENQSSDDKNTTKTKQNLNTTLTFLSQLAEVPVEHITKNEIKVGKVKKESYFASIQLFTFNYKYYSDGKMK